MKTRKLHIIAATALAFFIFSCESKKTDADGHTHEHGDSDQVWQEMDDFHIVMAETFHPYKDSANLDPAKERASELHAAAEEWASSTLPDKADNAALKAKLQQLKKDAALLAESVKSADDNTIASHLTKVHDTFHAIQEDWYGGH